MNFDTVLIALEMMWKGMFGIFAVIILITLIVMFLSKITKEDSDKEDI